MQNQRKKKITNYSILLNKMLGEGASGKVYVGEQDNTKLKVAIKVLEKKTVDRDYYLKSSLFSEIDILKALKSPNIVGFLDVMESKNCYYIIQQFCDGGELRQLMKKRGKIPEAEAINMLTQLCNGFLQLIKEGVMHWDLKPENILIHQGQLKLADFGFSKKDRAKRKVQQTMVGTPLYMPYQILRGMAYSSKCDIWSLGFIFYQMLYGRTPWTGNTQYELITNIQTKQVPFPYQVSPATKDFIMKCIQKDQNKRFSWDELLRHKIFNGYFLKKQQKDKQFQNKYKTIMNHLRQQVKQKNIDIESVFKQLGVNMEGSLTVDQFENLLVKVDPTLNKQQILYIFNKIALTGSSTITYEQFQKALQKSGIPMSMIGKKNDKVQKPNDPFGAMGGGLFQHLLNQFGGQQTTDAYNIQPLQRQQQINSFNPMNQMNQMNQIALIQQQHQQMISNMGGIKGFGNVGLGGNNLLANNAWGQQPTFGQQFGIGQNNLGFGLNNIRR